MQIKEELIKNIKANCESIFQEHSSIEAGKRIELLDAIYLPGFDSGRQAIW